MSRFIFRKTNPRRSWKLVPLGLILIGTVILLEQESTEQLQWGSDSNQNPKISLLNKI